MHLFVFAYQQLACSEGAWCKTRWSVRMLIITDLHPYPHLKAVLWIGRPPRALVNCRPYALTHRGILWSVISREVTQGSFASPTSPVQLRFSIELRALRYLLLHVLPGEEVVPYTSCSHHLSCSPRPFCIWCCTSERGCCSCVPVFARSLTRGLFSWSQPCSPIAPSPCSLFL